MAFIEQLGVRNLIVEAREAPDEQTLQKIRKLSTGLTLPGLPHDPGESRGSHAPPPRASGSRRSKLLPKPQGDAPIVYGVSPSYASIANLHVVNGRFFDDAETAAAAPVAVLGEGAAAALFGTDDPIGRYLKVNDQWFQVIGVAGPQLTVQTDVAGTPGAGSQQPDLRAALLGDLPARGRTELAEGRDRRHLPAAADIATTSRRAAALLRGLLNVSHTRGRRLHHRLAGGTARRAAPHAAHLRDGDGRDRVDLAARRRHRHHEHHARQRDGAHRARSASAAPSARSGATSSGSS